MSHANLEGHMRIKEISQEIQQGMGRGLTATRRKHCDSERAGKI